MPCCSATQSQRSWERAWMGLSSIFSHYWCPQTQRINATNLHKPADSHMQANHEQTCFNVWHLHITTLIGLVWSVWSDESVTTWVFLTQHDMGFICSPTQRCRKTRTAQRLYRESVRTLFISLLSQLRAPHLHTSHRKWPNIVNTQPRILYLFLFWSGN